MGPHFGVPQDSVEPKAANERVEPARTHSGTHRLLDQLPPHLGLHAVEKHRNVTSCCGLVLDDGRGATIPAKHLTASIKLSKSALNLFAKKSPSAGLTGAREMLNGHWAA